MCSDRVFILGPSHHKYIDGCALSACDKYETPIGDLETDYSSARLSLHKRETGR